jgi:hypothetical protein
LGHSRARDRPNVRSFVAQYFINYNLPKGSYLTSSPIITANWKASTASNIWTVPVGGGVGAIVLVDGFPINVNVSAYYNVVRPKANPVPTDVNTTVDLEAKGIEGPAWSLRLQLAL